jgi:hypothetical protein
VANLLVVARTHGAVCVVCDCWAGLVCHDGAGGRAWVPCVIIGFCVSEYWEANMLLN